MVRKRIIGFYDYTVVLTYVGLFFSMSGIFFAIEGNYTQTIICLMLAGLCDMFEGTVAATKNRTESEKRFGIQIDSLSDLLSFGALPAIFVFKISERNTVSFFAALLFVLCALIRLAYFNDLEEEKNMRNLKGRESFIGLPVTSIVIILPIIYIIYLKNIMVHTFVFSLLLLVTGGLFVSEIEIKNPDLKWKIALMVIGVIEFVCMMIS